MQYQAIHCWLVLPAYQVDRMQIEKTLDQIYVAIL